MRSRTGLRVVKGLGLRVLDLRFGVYGVGLRFIDGLVPGVGSRRNMLLPGLV